MSLGYAQDNPGDLRAGSFTYNGEVPSANGFRAFSSMPYGIRAWLLNLFTAITVHGRSTYGDYLGAFAPVADGNSPDYPATVCGSDFNPDDTIATDEASLKTLFYNQAHAEIGADADNITDDDWNKGYQLFASSAPATFFTVAAVLPGNTLLIVLVGLMAALVFILIIINF